MGVLFPASKVNEATAEANVSYELVEGEGDSD
jgi:hypothetical protein